MPVEINGLNPSSAKPTGEGAPARVGRDEPSVPQQQTGRPSTTDTVSLTDTAARLKGLENTIASLPVVDSQRVESIKKALANGSFPIDDQKVADKLVTLEHALDKRK
jgi:negative regulator of flagellin synthesis FlgM